MTLIGAREAAQLTGRDRSTILRAIENGKLSATRDEQGHYRIDVAELERAYGTLRSPVEGAEADAEAMPQPAYADAARAAALEREVQLLREMMQGHDRERQQWEEERTFLRSLIERQTEQVKLLTDERQQRERTPLFARLFRRSA